jgi:hypothetical protein
MSTIPQDLNWVQKRATCSAAQMFNELIKGINDDVAVLNSTRNLPTDQRYGADMTRDGTTVAVGQYGTTTRRRVLIGIVGDEIEVRDDTKQSKWRAQVKLNHEGRCMLRLEDGTDLEQWQFRKKALEGLFFGD